MKVIRFILIIGFVFQSIHAQAPKQYNVKGTAYYKSNILIEEAEVILMDTTEKVISRTKTSKKLLKKFGGGKFTFSNIKPGHYRIRIITEEEVNINHRFEVKNKSINVGRLYPFKEFPKYVQTDYPSMNLFKMRRFSTEPTPGDSINIRHIIVDLNGIAKTVVVDSVVDDSTYYTDANNLNTNMIQKDSTYFIYNDYGVFIFKSRSFKDRINELQQRDGFIIFQNNDTLYFDNIFFENEMDNPQVATFHLSDSTINTKYHSIFDIYKVRTGPSYVSTSVRKGFWNGIYTIGGIVTLQALVTKSFKPYLSLAPDFTPPIEGNYGTVVTIIPLFTLGRITYDWYKDKRSNYFMPTHENDPYLKNMFVFSFSEWVWKKSQPVIKPIINSRLVKWWSNRKLRKVQKEAAKRKSASD